MCVAVVVVALSSVEAADVFNMPTGLTSLETVPVGNPGNAGEWSGESYDGFGEDRICGAVDYVYRIGKFEVTAGQYTEFLNAVAKTDTYRLYNGWMNNDERGCQITRHGTNGSYTYDFSGRPAGNESDWVNRPVNYVSWGDAARFANWLHNGQPTGPQNDSTTEDGAYDLNGAMSNADLVAVTREADWTWAITSEDEWYKAAYHKNDGVTGNYFDYPTSNDTRPSNHLVDPDPGNNTTSYYIHFTIGSPYYRTEVGAHENSESPYGTYDMAGNVWEYNETISSVPSVGVRGGSFSSSNRHPRASFRGDSYPADEYNYYGFRVSEVPEPATLSLLALGGFAMLRRRRRK